MKLTNTRSIKSAKGMTLLELTVVILVLLSLISILFVGAKAWKKGSDRAANIMNIRNVQNAVRGHANMNGLVPVTENQGDATKSVLLSTSIFSQDAAGGNPATIGYLKAPTAPSTLITYHPMSVVPEIGVLYLAPVYTGTGTADYAPDVTLYSDW